MRVEDWVLLFPSLVEKEIDSIEREAEGKGAQ